MRRDIANAPGKDQSLPQWRAGEVLLRMPTVHHNIGRIETMFEEALIGAELERVGHVARCIGQHPVLRYDRIAFNEAVATHADRRSRLRA